MFLLDSKKIAKVLFDELLNSNEKDISKLVNNFLLFIKKNKIEKNLKNIIKYLDLEFKKYNHYNTIFLETPFKESDKMIDEIIDSQNLQTTDDNKIISLEKKELIGGFIIKFKNKIYDASLLNQINKLKSNMKS